MPKVSVIITTYNRAVLLDRAINSVFNQTYKDYELVIVDDGSTDHTQDIIKRYDGRLKYIYQKNAGLPQARNMGIRNTHGKYICFLDDDDYWTSQKLEIQVKILDENNHIGIVYGKMPVVNDYGQQTGIMPDYESGNNFNDLIIKGGMYPPSSVMTRRECFDKSGLFDDIVPVEDFDMWLRIVRYYDAFEVKEPVLGYYFRERDRQQRNKIKMYSAQVRLYRKILVSYDDIPRRIVEKKLARFLYLLAQAYEERGKYALALTSYRDAIAFYPFVGRFFFWEKDGLVKKILKSFRPFVHFMCCYLKYVRAKGQGSPN